MLQTGKPNERHTELPAVDEVDDKMLIAAPHDSSEGGGWHEGAGHCVTFSIAASIFSMLRVAMFLAPGE